MLTRIRQLRDSLSPAERRVADGILEDPHGIASLRMADLAKRTGVSDPTVVRFCRKVGTRGFNALRIAIARHLASNPGDVHASVRDGDTPDVVIRKVVSSSISELQRIQQSLEPQSLEDAAHHLLAARRIAFIGVGASAIVAQDANNKFFRLGLPTAAFTDGPTITQVAATTATNSVLVAISRSGTSDVIVRAAQIAARAGAVTVALTASDTPLAAASDVTLAVDSEEDTAAFTPMSSRLAQLATLDALQLCTVLSGGDRVRDPLDASKHALMLG
ncbi:MAG: MurR/RpiR family transcriptional regulator [Pseudomonadota bacterium]